MRTTYFFLIACIFCFTTFIGQTENTNENVAPVFQRIADGVKNYKLDTLTPPVDNNTKLINELRNLKGGFNINEFLQFKMLEESQKPENDTDVFRKGMDFFTTGNGKKWLDNAVINIYREHYTEKELKAMVKFAKTPAGKKMASETPIIILQAAAAGEMIQKSFEKQN